MSVSSQPAPASRATSSALRLVAILILCSAVLPLWAPGELAAAGVEHLVISEVVTGASSANDELIELYNPSSIALPLEGLELVYVSATGATVTRRAAWELGAAEMPRGSHLLVANQLGVYAPIADAVYTSGMAATGGSVALRIQGAATAIDAVGWGTAASMWLEGSPTVPPPAGSSIERLLGGPAGSSLDTDDNAADFGVRWIPDPQNTGSPPVPDPVSPNSTPTPAPTSTSVTTPSATPDPTATPTSPASVPIATARALPDGTAVTIEGTALTGSEFHDGGGYLSDASGGIAVLLDAGSFARGDRALVSGTLDDRFAQRTVRVAASNLTVIGVGDDPAPIASSTATVNESVEGRLVRVAGSLVGSASPLSDGLAFDLDDGSGAVRLIVGSSTGIDTTGWTAGRRLELVGVVGQRDSSGSGASGYRVQPRAAADILGLADATPSPSPSGSPGAAPSPTPSGGALGVSTIAQARAAPRNERLTVRGVVTLAPGTVDPSSAVIQDGSGAILLRLGAEVGRMPRGQLVEVEGVRSTKSGMESLRISRPARRLGRGSEPPLHALRSGDASEALEAQLVVVRGALVASARRASSRTVSFEIDDGSGPLRVVLGASLRADASRLRRGTWVEVRGVLGQETGGAQPLSGYRVWPRSPGEVRIVAPANGSAAATDDAGSVNSAALGSLDAIDTAGGADLRIGATLVLSAWPELGIAGLLWDGHRLVAVAPSSADGLAAAIGPRVTPLALELTGVREIGTTARLGVATVALGQETLDTIAGSSPPASPTADLPGPDEPARWVTVVARSSGSGDRRTYGLDDASVTVEQACEQDVPAPEGVVRITGVALGGGARIVVPCGGIRAAPQLDIAARASADRAPAGTAHELAGAATADHGALRRGLAAAVLAASAIVIGAAGMVRHRLRDDRAGDDADANLDGDPATGTPAEAGSVPMPPQLTLVSVPHERGP